MYPAIQAMLDAKPTDDYLLFSFLYFLRQEDDHATAIDVDVPIKELFTDSLTDAAFTLTIILFELHHGIDIPDEYHDWDQSIRELLRRVATLPTLSSEEFGKHLQMMIRTFGLAAPLN